MYYPFLWMWYMPWMVRTVMDYTRLTQNGHYDGWIEVDGAREALPSGSMGTRDRSWGVRPIGAADPQFAGRSVPQFVTGQAAWNAVRLQEYAELCARFDWMTEL